MKDYNRVWLATLIFFAGYYALILPLPRYLVSIGLPDWQIGVIMGATVAASLIFRSLTGSLVDSIGTRPVLIFGALALTIGAGGVPLTTFAPLLFILRMFQAVGYVTFTTAGTALVSLLSTSDNRGRRLAMFAVSANIAMALVPALLDFCLRNGLLSQEGAFWFIACMALSALGIVIIRPLRGTHAMSNGQNLPRKPLKLSQLWVFPRPLWLPMLTMMLLGMGYCAFFQFFTLLADRRGVQPAGMLFTAYGIAIIIARLTLGRYIDRVSFRAMMLGSMVVTILGLLLAAFGNTAPMLIAAAACIGSAGGLFHPALIAHHVMVLPTQQGRATASAFFGFDISVGIGAWLLGIVLDIGGLTAMYLVAAGIVSLSAFIIPSLVRQRQLILATRV